MQFWLKGKEIVTEDYLKLLTPKYKEFEVKYNQLLKEKSPSFVDEIKRQIWFSKSIIIKDFSLNEVDLKIRKLIANNFHYGEMINEDNFHLLKYLIEKKSEKIYKIREFKKNFYHYATLGQNSILSVKFTIKKKFWSKKMVVKYFQAYLGEKPFTFSTYSQTIQRNKAKQNFYAQFILVRDKILNVFHKEEKV